MTHYRTSPRITILPVLLAIFVAVARPGLGADEAVSAAVRQREAEAEIWALEQAYWESNRDADYQRIIDAWHDRFLGWPKGEPKPIDKEAGARYVRKSYTKPAGYTFTIDPTGIRILGDVAVNHYWVHLVRKEAGGQPAKRSMRITHTWVRSRSGWKILGGMSAGE